MVVSATGIEKIMGVSEVSPRALTQKEEPCFIRSTLPEEEGELRYALYIRSPLAYVLSMHIFHINENHPTSYQTVNIAVKSTIEFTHFFVTRGLEANAAFRSSLTICVSIPGRLLSTSRVEEN